MLFTRRAIAAVLAGWGTAAAARGALPEREVAFPAGPAGPGTPAGGRPLRLSPATLPPPVGFSHLSEASGRIIYISGQVPHDAKGDLVGEGDFEAQLHQIFTNLTIAAREAGSSCRDLVKLNYYCDARVDRTLLRHVTRVRDQYVDTSRPPASTFVFVAGLVRPGWLIEIDAVLAIPS